MMGMQLAAGSRAALTVSTAGTGLLRATAARTAVEPGEGLGQCAAGSPPSRPRHQLSSHATSRLGHLERDDQRP